jgi:hypothetical protein
MKQKKMILILAIMISLLVACSSTANDVPTLGATPTAIDELAELDNEAKVMAFAQCMRDEGFELKDPTVDADGNVQIPEPIEGVSYTRAEIRVGYEVCGVHLEGITFGRQREITSEMVDQLVELASCLRDKGYEVDDPTAETLQAWRANLRVDFDFNDPEAMEAFQECSGGAAPNRGNGK